METIIILVILAAIFIIIARRLPAAKKEMNLLGDDFINGEKDDGNKMNKAEVSEGEFGPTRKSRFKKPIARKNPKVKGRLTIDDLLVKAEELMAAKDYEQAEKILIGAVEIEPNNDKVYNKLGILYIEQENFSDAKEAFKTALRYDKLNDLTYNNLGLALFNQGRYNEAIEAYQKSIHLNSLIPHRYINLGLSYAALRQYEKALDAYKKALVLDKDNKDYQKLIREVQEKIEELKVE
jgi:tetratricopeptide (TPR) repeat protein